MPYIRGMKITMNIDEAMLKRVMAAHGITSKTKAVDLALRELDRRSELKRLLSTNLGFADSEIIAAFDVSHDLPALRAAEQPAAYTKGTKSEIPAVKHAPKSRSRR